VCFFFLCPPIWEILVGILVRLIFFFPSFVFRLFVLFRV